MKRADHKQSENSIANCRQRLGQDEVQDKDQNEVKFKMSAGMGVMNCADNKGDKKPCHDDREGHQRPLEQDSRDGV